MCPPTLSHPFSQVTTGSRNWRTLSATRQLASTPAGSLQTGQPRDRPDVERIRSRHRRQHRWPFLHCQVRAQPREAHTEQRRRDSREGTSTVDGKEAVEAVEAEDGDEDGGVKVVMVKLRSRFRVRLLLTLCFDILLFQFLAGASQSKHYEVVVILVLF